MKPIDKEEYLCFTFVLCSLILAGAYILPKAMQWDDCTAACNDYYAVCRYTKIFNYSLYTSNTSLFENNSVQTVMLNVSK